MRFLSKFAIGLIIAVMVSVPLAISVDLAVQDGLADRLDGPTVNTVGDYLDDTRIPRTIGFALLLLMWSPVVVAIDRGLDVLSSKRPLAKNPD